MLKKSKIYVIGNPIPKSHEWVKKEFTQGQTMSASTGTVARLIKDKGFGFIRTEDGEELFFHRSECKDGFETMNEGDKVEFRRESSPKGPRANSVRVL